MGGTDTGPTPYELLLGSLAACIGATLRLYASHKGIQLAAVDVELELDRVHADDCLECDERAEGWIDRIQSAVTIRGDFDEAQRTRLAQVARRCPVHKTLANGVTIVDAVTFARRPDAGVRVGGRVYDRWLCRVWRSCRGDWPLASRSLSSSAG